MRSTRPSDAKSLGEQTRSIASDCDRPGIVQKIQDATLATTKLSKNVRSGSSRSPLRSVHEQRPNSRHGEVGLRPRTLASCVDPAMGRKQAILLIFGSRSSVNRKALKPVRQSTPSPEKWGKNQALFASAVGRAVTPNPWAGPRTLTSTEPLLHLHCVA